MTTKNLTSKRNVMVALTMLGFFVVVGIVSLFSVFALSSSNLSSNLNVSYVTNNVSADVSANYWISGSLSKTNFSGGDSGTKHILASEDQNATKSLSMPNNLVLAVASDKIIFEFVFENTSNEVDFTIQLSGSPMTNVNTKNMVQKYYVSNSQLQVSDYTSGSIVWQNSLSVQTIEGFGTKKYVYIEAYVDSIVRDSVYEGGFSWTLDTLIENS